jgi:hypothetical protein
MTRRRLRSWTGAQHSAIAQDTKRIAVKPPDILKVVADRFNPDRSIISNFKTNYCLGHGVTLPEVSESHPIQKLQTL